MTTFNTLPRVEAAATVLDLGDGDLLHLLSIPYHGSRLLQRAAAQQWLADQIAFNTLPRVEAAATPDPSGESGGIVDFQYPTTGRGCCNRRPCAGGSRSPSLSIPYHGSRLLQHREPNHAADT